jgi:signal peptidase I
LKKIPGVVANSIIKEIDSSGSGNVFPHDTTYFRWTADNFGPLWVPKKGATINLTPQNIDLYTGDALKCMKRNTWEQQGERFLSMVKEATTYTFKMDYYWMMGDNRHKSQDSRFWGFVPEDHIVGKHPLSGSVGNMDQGGIACSDL